MSIRERWNNLFRPIVYYFSVGSDAPTQVLNYTARQLYQTQDNLQAVVNYLSNSIAQLPLKVYKRKDETDRMRDRDSIAAKLLWKPNEDQTEFEFIRALAIEYFVFGAVYVWVLPDAESDSGYQLRILPSGWIIGITDSTAYAPGTIRVCTKNGGSAVDVPKTEFIQFRTYSAGNPSGYLSPISALRQTLQEQVEAGNFRKELWHSSGRLNAQLIRPANVQPWDDETRKKFITTFRESWGSGGSKAGSIPLLEDGMEIKPYSTSFKEAEWSSSVQLSRESVAAAYGVNPSLIWHTTSQTYASAKDNARALYADCLGPTLQMLQQRINSFLIPRVDTDQTIYVEFDLTEKLKGSFEERASILQTAVGGPWLTRNEARADNNLPPIEGGDQLIVPLNISTGDAQSAQPVGVEPAATETNAAPQKMISKAASMRIKGASAKEEDAVVSQVISEFLKRQKRAVLPKIGAGSDWWDKERWDAELAADLLPAVDKIADRHGTDTAKTLGTSYGTEVTRNYLEAMTSGRAAAINASTQRKIAKAVEDYDEEDEESESPEDAFDKRESADSGTLGRALATATASWAVIESVNQAKHDGYHKMVEKEWVTGYNARPSHAAMNGERVPIDEAFSNGAMWPGDDNLDADESCGCNCSTDVIITEE